MVSWVRTTAFLGLVFMGLAREAQAGSGDGVGLGPVFGITTEGSLSLGWELGGSYRGPLAHASLGGSYQLKREGNDPAYYHYLVLEPWFVVGGTIGAGLTDTREVRFVYGLWEGYTADLDDPLLERLDRDGLVAVPAERPERGEHGDGDHRARGHSVPSVRRFIACDDARS